MPSMGWAGAPLPLCPCGWNAYGQWEREQPLQPTDEGYGLRMLEQQERRKLGPLVMELSYQPWTTVPDF